MEKQFLDSWDQLTKSIKKAYKTGGSRLHRVDALVYVAYAIWDSQEHYRSEKMPLPLEAEMQRKAMREACVKIETLMEMDVLKDLLEQM